MIYSNQLNHIQKQSIATPENSRENHDLELASLNVASDLDEFEEPFTKSSSTHSSHFRMEGFFMDKSELEKSQLLSLSFLLSSDFESMPPAFLKWNEEESAYILDLYEIHLGGAILTNIEEEPIFKMTVEEIRIDLNKGIAGLNADPHNILRLKFFVSGKPDCQIFREPEGKIVVNFEWKDEAEWVAWLSKLNFWK